ncbi:hypothetical protein, partial [Asaia sp. HN010]|uniref:hypothetical protein n=1 Tax=Asaia sp. HN010 TaxID=3081233 RepID=UPI003015A616
VARQAHNLKAAGSNPAPATIYKKFPFNVSATQREASFAFQDPPQHSTQVGLGVSAVYTHSYRRTRISTQKTGKGLNLSQSSRPFY